MAILEEDVLVPVNGKSANHYEKLGYIIPKYKDKSGRIRIKRGTKLLVKTDDIYEGSNIEVTKICDICEKKVPKQRYIVIVNQRNDGDGLDRCNNCGRQKSKVTLKNNVKYENSFEYWAKENNKEYLLDEFSDENIKKPNQISYGTPDEYLWKCSKCASPFEMSPHHRTSGDNNCPYCAGKRVNHTNCLWTTHPEIAKFLEDEERGYVITAGRHSKEIFKCIDCGNTEEKSVYNVVRQGYSCSYCGDGVSYPEKFMMNFLQQLNIDFKTQEMFDWSKKIYHLNPKYKKLSGSKKYDFYIPNLNMIIETHGDQHYNEKFNILGARNQSEEQENDDLKKLLALNNNINIYITVDCRRSELIWIKNNILNSKLSDMFDLSNIDWLKCHEYACKSLVKVVCDLWNGGMKDTKTISKILKCGRYTATHYLKQGAKLGWCNYNPKEEMIKNGKSQAIAIVQLTKDGEFIREWNMLKEAGTNLNIKPSSISLACKEKLKTSGGFKWMYKEDYEKQLELIQNN